MPEKETNGGAEFTGKWPTAGISLRRLTGVREEEKDGELISSCVITFSAAPPSKKYKELCCAGGAEIALCAQTCSPL